MKTFILPTLAAVLLIGCSEDEVTTAPEVDSAIVEDTGGTTTETSPGDDTSTPSDGTTDETSTEDGSTPETSTDAPATDAPATDAPSGDTAGAPTIKCGATTCNPSTQACCLNVAGVGSCIAKAGSCMGVSTKWECSDGDTCGSGQKCCATIALTGSGSQCKATCAMGEVQLCDSNDECTGGGMCSAIGGSTTGYSRCP